jgi:UDP-N-acetylmuramyl pentapeptide phosphotransferase/UDP-N-acetylglucosamine-1-phosphate transferase
MEWSPSLLPLWTWPLLAAGVSAALTESSIRYAHRRNLIDQPGRRRSHSLPTPRGGGIGIIVAIALALIASRLAMGDSNVVLLLATLVGLTLVALIGWWDDHRPLPAWPKLLVHLLAASLYVAAMVEEIARANGGHFDGVTLFIIGGAGLCLIGLITWSINLHNFMDGINGLLAWQSVFVFASLGFLATAQAEVRYGWLAMAAAALAFVPFNFPRARVFMGDVGSGGLGFVFVAALMPAGNPTEAFGLWVILDSAFIVDTTATLLVRVMVGRRWYSAHREHLYQWLVRCGFSHARVVGIYALWNLCAALPCAIAYVKSRSSWSDDGEARFDASAGFWLMPAVLLAGSALWIFGKRWCLRRRSHQGAMHAHA